MKKGKKSVPPAHEVIVSEAAPLANQDVVIQQKVEPTIAEPAVVEPTAIATDGSLERQADRFLIHVRALNSALACLEARQVSSQILTAELARQKLNESQLDALDSFISMNRFARFLERLSQVLGREAIGLECADFMNGGSMGVLGGAIVSAPNLAASVGALTRYMSLYADLSYVSFTVGEETAQFSWSYSPLVVARGPLCDRSARIFVLRMRHLFADNWQPLRVQLQRQRPKDRAPYRLALCPNISFDAPFNVIEFPASDLLMENRYADKDAFELAVALAERMMRERRVPDDLSIRVREVILDHLREGPLTAVDTARRLGVSTRVLQRRLAALGTSYQKLCDSIRIELAQELLSQTALPMSEIAYRIGFSNQANFTRAVKRWFGVSPRAFRHESRH